MPVLPLSSSLDKYIIKTNLVGLCIFYETLARKIITEKTKRCLHVHMFQIEN